MPLYDYQCRECKKEWSEQRPMEARNHVAKCGGCGGKGLRLWKCPSVVTFKPYWAHHIDKGPTPIRIEGRRQLEEECKKRGLELLDGPGIKR